MMKKHHNALGDLFYSDKKHDEEMAKLDALNKIASKSSTGSTWIYIIIISGVVITGVLLAVAMKKKG